MRTMHLRFVFCCAAIMGILLLAPSLQAWQESPAPDPLNDAIKAAVDFAAPSVVQVETIGGLEQVDKQLVGTAPSTGVVIGADGWIVSSSFAFRQQPSAILVRLADGNRLSARLVAKDTLREVVLLKIEPPSALQPITICPENEVEVGETVIALGKSLDPNIASPSVGVVSATGRVWGKAVQTDARVSPNNYGGALIDLQGRCLGILAPLNPGDGSVEDGAQWYDSGIAFAVPLPSIEKNLERWKNGEDLFPGKLGLTLTERDDYKGPVLVRGTSVGSPAAKAGLKPGDKILSANDRPVEMVSHLKLVLGGLNAGESVRLKLQRGTETIDATCDLVKEIPPYRSPYLGIIPVDAGEGKISVAWVAPESPASRAGLQPTDTISEFMGKPIKNLQELREQLAVQPLASTLELSVASKDAASKKTITPISWPTDPLVPLPDEDPVASGPKETAAVQGTGVVELALGDVKNKMFAFVPPSYKAEIPHGVLIFLPEAGEFDQRQILDTWEPLCRQYRWILAVVGSAEEQGWSREESDLASRLLSKLEATYSLDRSRIVVGGINAGGSLGLLAAFGAKTRFSAVMVLGSQLPRGLQVEGGEPMSSLKVLLVGDAQLADPSERFTLAGHPASHLKAEIGTGGKIENSDRAKIFGWLRGLERL